ncbi:MAG: flagellar protein FlaG, partial [Firmicutes bacterium]|nr:flagellar protein FlaG [Bacillota bacterium]
EEEGAQLLSAMSEVEAAAPPRSVVVRTTELLNAILADARRQLKFRVHEGTGRIWVQVIDTRTQEVVKEIPPERYLDLVARIWELVGILVDERA